MSLASGARLGCYEVIAPLGAGGMGEVYRARDSRLKREVALKVLPASLAGDRERLARFQREAEVLASLNHSNIAQIYGIEESALVMELVAGEDLAQRLTRGPIPIDEALPIAKQIAEALESAHDAGIVHRDLKPANVKVREDGTVKVLDFGLAKALDSGLVTSTPDGLTNSPTITSPAMTLGGVILGTAAYMAPEQAKGKAIDKRADVWAMGCVLYEMLAGRKAFEGEDVTDTLTSVMRDEPDWNALPAATPQGIRTLLRRCLEKDARKRAPHAAVARLAIEDAMTPGADAVVAAAPRARMRATVLAAGGLAVALAAAAGYWAATPRTTERAPSPYRSTLLVDENLNPRAPSLRFALSPDGRRFVYVAADNANRPRLWIRSLDGLTSQVLPGTEGAGGPFWSPDSRFVAFFANGELKKIDVNGGPPLPIASGIATNITEAPGVLAQDAVQGIGGTWNADGVILFSTGRLARVSAAGGVPQPVTTFKDGETSHDYPQFLPDGRHFIFAAYKQRGQAGMYVGSLDGAPPVRLMNDSSNAQFANGYLLFIRGTALMAQPFDERRLMLSGEARPLVDSVLTNLTVRPGAAFSVSRTGVLVYQTAVGFGGSTSRLVWSTRAGVQSPVADEPTTYRDLRLSPDGTRASLVSVDERGRSDLWVLNIARGVRTRMTFTGTAVSAAWSPDGKTLVVNGGREQPALVRKAVDGSGNEQAVSSDDQPKLPFDWSPDGRTLLYETFSQQSLNDVWAMPVDGTGTAVAIATTRFSERWPQFSPDGRWIAYTSVESGVPEVYVTRFSGNGRWQVSAAGGTYPRWSRDGRELFFFTPNNKISVVPIKVVRDTIEAGPTTPLFDARPPAGFARYFYDVAPDGRFLLSAPVSTNTSTMVTLLVNWPSLLTGQ